MAELGSLTAIPGLALRDSWGKPFSVPLLRSLVTLTLAGEKISWFFDGGQASHRSPCCGEGFISFAQPWVCGECRRESYPNLRVSTVAFSADAAQEYELFLSYFVPSRATLKLVALSLRENHSKLKYNLDLFRREVFHKTSHNTYGSVWASGDGILHLEL